MTNDQHFRPAPASSGSGVRVDIDPENAGWGWSGLKVVELDASGSFTFPTGDSEVIVLPLAGSFDVHTEEGDAHLVGRTSVFTGVSDFVYVGRSRTVTVTSSDGGRFALPMSRARRDLPFRYVAAGDVSVEFRGTGSCSRQVNNFCTPDTFEADRMIACEVLTPGGNWSSYPPHKHDTSAAPTETKLEETYYHRLNPSQGFAFQRVYTDDRSIDQTMAVEDGDVVMVPEGYHPVGAPHGYDLYYLNVMAGPERRWCFKNDPQHEWIVKK